VIKIKSFNIDLDEKDDLLLERIISSWSDKKIVVRVDETEHGYHIFLLIPDGMEKAFPFGDQGSMCRYPATMKSRITRTTYVFKHYNPFITLL
jgi:hypothetical protein